LLLPVACCRLQPLKVLPSHCLALAVAVKLLSAACCLTHRIRMRLPGTMALIQCHSCAYRLPASLTKPCAQGCPYRKLGQGVWPQARSGKPQCCCRHQCCACCSKVKGWGDCPCEISYSRRSFLSKGTLCAASGSDTYLLTTAWLPQRQVKHVKSSTGPSYLTGRPFGTLKASD
jgi:hypothetical protein